MAILSVAVEANGWVLAIRGDWLATSGAWEFSGSDRVEGHFLNGAVDQFPLEPNGTPKIQLSVVRQGFTRGENGLPVASSADVQKIIATKALRKPYPNQIQLDETDHGDGTRTVRLALSDRLYVGDVVSGCTFAAGWKAGEAGSSAACTNASDQPLPVAISRFVQPGWSLVRGTNKFTAEVIVASHHPRHFGAEANQAVAAVSFMATDGTTKLGPFWASVGGSDRGDGLRCWRAEIDLSGLSAGPVSVSHTTYPWVGVLRAQSAEHSLDAADGLPTAWAAPLMLSYDPSGTLYPNSHVYVNAETGTATASAVTVGATLVAAKAGTAAVDVQTALQALYLANYTLPIRNGWASATRVLDWATVTLAEGVQAIGTTGVSFGAKTTEGRLILRGDPAAIDPRNACILRTGATNGVKRISRLWMENLTVEHGESNWGGGMAHFENVELRGKNGFQTATTGSIVDAPHLENYAQFSFCRSTYWKFGSGLGASSTRQRTLLLRSTGATRTCLALVLVNCDKPDDGLYNRSAGTAVAFGGWNSSASAVTDAMLWGNRAKAWNGSGIDASGAKASGSGTLVSPAIYSRFAAVNNLIECVPTDSGARMFRLGATPVRLLDSVIESNTFVGAGFNSFYDGGLDNPAQGGNAVPLEHSRNVVRNNLFSRHAIKGDIFLSNGALTGNWQHLYGVAYAANLHGNAIPDNASGFQHAFFGVGSLTFTDYVRSMDKAFFGFVDDQSANGAGWGDYRPEKWSPAAGLGQACCIDVDAAGAMRGRMFASGAMAGDPQPAELWVMGQSASLMLRSDSPMLRIDIMVRPPADLLRMRDFGVRLTARHEVRLGYRGRTIEVEGDDRTQRVGRD